MGLKITNLPISNYMTAYPISVDPKVPLMEAINFMAERGFGNLVVSDGVTPKGILTEREILKAIVDSKDLHKLKVRDAGWQPYVRLSLGYTVLDAAHQMIRKKSRLLVFDEDKLVGIITVSDLLRAFRKTRNDSSLDDVISTRVEKCKSSDSVFDAVKKLHEKRIGSIIIDDMKGYGIFTERDLLTHITSDKFDLYDQVGKYSASPVIVANVGITVHEAASIMAAKNIKRLGLTKDGLLVSMATARDIVDAYQSVYPVTNPYLEDLSEYISG
jgi:CBS domain-containing protein